MKFRVILFGLLMMGLVCATWGAWVEVTSPIADQVPVVEVRNLSENTWQMEVSIPGVTHEAFSQEGSTFDRVSLPMEMMVGAEGEAELPVVSRMIALRLNGNPDIEIVSENWVELDGTYELAPDMENERASELAGVYAQRDDYLPEASFVVTPRQIMGGVSLAVVQVRAAKYNPIQRKIMVLQNAEILVHETGTPISYDRPITETTAKIIKAIVPNWEDVLLNVDIVKGSYLYIISSKNSLEDEAEELITWRKRKGYTVELADTIDIGSTSYADIKTFILGRYNSADPPLEYVCLLGDESGPYPVPYHYVSGSYGAGDWFYSCLEGSDVLPDVNIGRLCFDSPDELTWLVRKTCDYEKDPAPPTGGSAIRNWYKGAGCIAGDPWGSGGLSIIQTVRWNRERMLEAGYISSSIDTFYHPDGVDEGDITYSFNAGSSLICYRGGYHMLYYDEDDIINQNNEMRLPFIVTICCATNNFNYDSGRETICELLLKAGSVEEPKGAIGAIGMATAGTHTRFNNILMGGVFQGLLREGLHTMGGSLTRSKVELAINYPVDPYDYVEDFCHWESLLGDPAVDIFTDTPEQLYVDNPSTVPIGTNTLTLTVTGESAQPIEGAYVNLVKGTEVFVGDWTDASGQVVLNFETTGEDSLYVTATKHNCRPAINSTWVTSSSRYVSPASSVVPIDDDMTGESSGDDDGLANPGETIEVNLSLKNWGTSTANGVEATLSITDPFVASISDGYEDHGTINAGATDNPPDDFDFTLASYAPDGYELQFDLTVTDDVPNTWISSMVVTVSNADFEYASHLLEGDGVLYPGESEQRLQLTVDNIGTRLSEAGTIGYLRSGNPAVTIIDSSGTFAEGTPGGQCTTTEHFHITATMNAFPGEIIPLTCIIPQDNGFADTVLFTLPIGSIASTDPTPPDSHGYWAFDNTDVAYAKHPTYSWIEIDPSLGGSGSSLNITDNADEDDETKAIELPFTFRYYGQDFDSISVCSNGWLAMGADQVVHTTFRNWNIPGALGPSGMIAPFWDDLQTSDPSSSPGINPPNIQNVGPSRDVRTDDFADSYTEELLDRIQDYKHRGLYDAELWNEYLRLTSSGDKPPQGHLDQGGEDCANATVVGALPYSDSGTMGASDDCTDRPYRDVFYVFTAPSAGGYTFDMCNSNGDTYLRIWTDGTCCSGASVTADDECGDFDPTITVSLAASQVVYIECGYYYSYVAASAYNFNVSELGPGSDCGSSIGVTLPAELPYSDIGQTTCGRVDDYESTCLDIYDGGEDIIYELTVTSQCTVDITLYPNASYTGICIDDECPPGSSCMDYSTSSGSSAHGLSGVILAPGSYYVMVDTWPTPDCIPDFDLFIDYGVPSRAPGIYSYHDATNHRFIIEWTGVYKYGGINPQETFECILYEPGYPSTPTGDGEILFQYLGIINTSDVSTSNDYATVGIENLTETDGVLFNYWNQAGPGAASMTSGRAILFTTQKAPPAEPKAPENLTAIRAGNDIELQWNEVDEDIYGNPITVTGYKIYRDTTPEFTPDVGNYQGTTSNLYYTDTGAAADDKYFYVVQAIL